MKKCGDCIHADVCERIPIYTEFNRNNPAYCNGFQDKSDYTQVVRCKNCKHHKDEHLYGTRLRFDWCRKFNNVTKDDDFCSYGERKDNVI